MALRFFCKCKPHLNPETLVLEKPGWQGGFWAAGLESGQCEKYSAPVFLAPSCTSLLTQNVA